MNELLMLALKLALIVWGVNGTRVDIAYDPLSSFPPGTVGAYAYGDINDCYIRVYDGFEFYERQEGWPNLEPLRDIIVHELGHCFGYRGNHSQDECSIMFWFYGTCDGKQVLTVADRMVLFNYRNAFMAQRRIIGGISHD